MHGGYDNKWDPLYSSNLSNIPSFSVTAEDAAGTEVPEAEFMGKPAVMVE